MSKITYNSKKGFVIKEEKTPLIYNGGMSFFDCGIKKLKKAPKKITGYFELSYNKLTSLNGAPEEVGDFFNVRNNNLKSLKGAPKKVGESFYCNYNELTSLNGAPKEVKGVFDCRNNKLKTLEGAPKKILLGSNNEASFFCDDNQLTSLKGVPKGITYLSCSGNSIPLEEILKFSKENPKVIIHIGYIKNQKISREI